MSRSAIPFQADDVSSLARALRAQLLRRATVPGHVELLNMLARSVGCRNFQHLRAQVGEAAIAVPASAPIVPEAAPVDSRLLERVRRCFTPEGRLLRWPARRSDQILALWGIWSKLPARTELTDQQISQRLRDLHDFGDHALLRRELCDAGLVHRTADGRSYRRIEKPPPAEAAALIGLIWSDGARP
jgi:hypothetical protein